MVVLNVILLMERYPFGQYERKQNKNSLAGRQEYIYAYIIDIQTTTLKCHTSSSETTDIFVI